MTMIDEQIRDLLNHSELSSEEVGTILGINPVSVRRFRSGAMGLSIEKLTKLADFLGYQVSVTSRVKNGRKKTAK